MQHQAVPSTLRLMNRRAILKQLLRGTPLSRAEIANAAGMSAVTVGKIVDDLIEERILEHVEVPSAAPAKVGRPGQLVRLESKRDRLLLIQLGVVHCRLAAVPLGYTGQDTWAVTFPTPATADALTDRLAEALKPFHMTGLMGTLVSVPGIVDVPGSTILFSPNLHWTQGLDFSALLAGTVPTPLLLVQEIQALALGHLTTHPDESHFLLADFGHGVGGAIVVDGDLYRPPLPFNGEFGHTRVLGNGRTCGCGGVGCVETLVSRRGIFQTMLQAMIQSETQPAEAQAKTPYAWPRVVSRVKQHGLEPWLKEALTAAAGVIGGALNVLGLGHVVVTGSLNELPGEVTSFLADEIRRQSLRATFGGVTCQFAPRQRMRGLIRTALDQLLPA